VGGIPRRVATLATLKKKTASFVRFSENARLPRVGKVAKPTGSWQPCSPSILAGQQATFTGRAGEACVMWSPRCLYGKAASQVGSAIHATLEPGPPRLRASRV